MFSRVSLSLLTLYIKNACARLCPDSESIPSRFSLILVESYKRRYRYPAHSFCFTRVHLSDQRLQHPRKRNPQLRGRAQDSIKYSKHYDVRVAAAGGRTRPNQAWLLLTHQVTIHSRGVDGYNPRGLGSVKPQIQKAYKCRHPCGARDRSGAAHLTNLLCNFTQCKTPCLHSVKLESTAFFEPCGMLGLAIVLPCIRPLLIRMFSSEADLLVFQNIRRRENIFANRISSRQGLNVFLRFVVLYCYTYFFVCRTMKYGIWMEDAKEAQVHFFNDVIKASITYKKSPLVALCAQ